MDPEDGLIRNKAQRLTYINHLLYRHPRGLTTRELARLCNVNQRTIQRDLRDLEDMGVPLWPDEGRYRVLEGHYIPPIHLKLPEAVALYLAGRLLARYSDRCDAHTFSALLKLANVLPQPMSAHMHASIQRLATREQDHHMQQVMEVLATAWAGQRVVHIRYFGAQSEEPREYDLCPYCLEASGEGNAIYVIGWAVQANELRTFKLERIQEAQLTEETFDPPADFDAPALLDSCWGIMYGEEKERVTLRFAPSATRRLLETTWHPSQSLDVLPDGGCLLRLEIAHPEEMIYWIRGWGPQVEVLEPAWLRERMAAEAKATAALYAGGEV